MQADSFHLDEAALRRRLRRRASRYAEADFLAREAGRRMDERLEMVLHQPTRILDLGCGGGADLPLLRARYPDAQLIGADLSPEMLQQVPRSGGLLQRLLKPSRRPQLLGAQAQSLPLRSASVSLIWSNLMLLWLDDPAPALREAHRVLEVGGLLTFSTLGPDTLRELRNALPPGPAERVHRFIDMHDLGDELVRAGFADPVMDMELITLEYAGPAALLRDLRLSAATNLAASRQRGLSGRKAQAELEQALQACMRGGQLPVSIELIQGHAWKAAPKVADDGRAIVRFMPRPT